MSRARYTDASGEVWVSAGEVAEVLHVDPKTVSRWAKEGKLPYHLTLSGHRRFPENEIRAMAATLHFDPEPDPGRAR